MNSNEPPGKAKKRGAETRPPMYTSVGGLINNSPKPKHTTPHDIGEIINTKSSNRSGGADVRKLKQVMGNG